MLTLASIILSFLSGSDFSDRAEGLSPTVVVRDTSFSKPTERVGKITPPPEKATELAWGKIKSARRPDDILMDSPYVQSQRFELDQEVGF